MSDLRTIPVPSPKTGERIEVMSGVRSWRNAGNEFCVVEVHYTADPERRGDWRYKKSPKYGGLRSWRWRKEQEIDFTARKGRLIFELYGEQHYIDSFRVPDHWPKWILVDPGWNNPASILWVAVDADSKPNEDGYRPIHVYREFYHSRRTSKQLAYVCLNGSEVIDPDGVERREQIESIIMDPGAGQEHQSASSGDPEKVSADAETVLDQFRDGLVDLGWSVEVETGNNHKSEAIAELNERIGTYWCAFDGRGLYDEKDQFRPPTDAELLDGAYQVAPTIFVHKTCPETHREIRGYRWAEWSSTQVEKRRNEPEKPIDKDDHSITNLIRFTNFLRSVRGDPGDVHRGFGDLIEFESNHRRRKVVDADEMAREHHRTRAGRFRKTKGRPYGAQ